MSKLANPPKLRSYVDHWPQSGDLIVKAPVADTYVDHFAKTGDLARPPLTKPRSYVSHFARPEDLALQ